MGGGEGRVSGAPATSDHEVPMSCTRLQPSVGSQLARHVSAMSSLTVYTAARERGTGRDVRDAKACSMDGV